MNTIEYQGLLINSKMSRANRCEFLIGNKIYHFSGDKIRSCETVDLAINNLSKDYIKMLLETACEIKWIKMLNYCKKNELIKNFPVKILLKSQELNKIVYVDFNGWIRDSYEIMEYPKELIIRNPLRSLKEATIEDVLK